MTESHLGRITGFVKRRWKVLLPSGVGLVAVLAWLAFGYFGVQFLFINDEVDEALPVFASGAGASGLPSDEQPAELVEQMNAAMSDEGTAAEVEVDEAPMMEGAEVLVVARGEFVDRSHPGQGSALVLNDGSEQRFLRFEDFRTDNGPDLNVYLSTAPPDAPAGDFDDEFVDLGDLKGNIGPQNYEIPVGTDLERYSTVVVWCVRFGVAFTAAPLA